MNPLKYMIFTVALYFLFLAALDLKLTDLAPEQRQPANADPMMLEVLDACYQIVNEGMRTILFAAPPVFAWVGGFFLGRRRFRLGRDGGLWAWANDMVSAPRSFNFAESCSLWLHVFAHVILIVTLPAIAIVALGHRSAIIWALLPTMGYYTWAAKGFYGRGWFYSSFVVLVSYVCFQLLFLTVVGLSIVAAFWMSR